MLIYTRFIAIAIALYLLSLSAFYLIFPSIIVPCIMWKLMSNIFNCQKCNKKTTKDVPTKQLVNNERQSHPSNLFWLVWLLMTCFRERKSSEAFSHQTQQSEEASSDNGNFTFIIIFSSLRFGLTPITALGQEGRSSNTTLMWLSLTRSSLETATASPIKEVQLIYMKK